MGQTNPKRTVIIIFVISIFIIMLGLFGLLIKYLNIIILQIPDQNGLDIAPVILTDEEVQHAKYPESYYPIGKKTEYNNDGLSGINNQYSNRDTNLCKISFTKVSGIYIANAYLGCGKKVNFDIDSTLSKGNLKFIVTNESGEILYTIQANAKDKLSFVATAGEVYYLKCITESATFSVTIERFETP